MKNFDTLFDDVRENAIAAAAAVSKQAAKLYDASKHRISAEGIKRSIAKKLIELGKLTYKAATQDSNLSEDIAKTVAEITELKQSLAVVNAHIASIKNQKICPDCGNTIPQYSVFCNLCGHKFEIEEPVAGEEAPVAEETAEAAAEEAVTEAPETVEDDITIAVAEEAPAAEETAEEENEIVTAAEEAVAEIAEAEEETPAAEEAAAEDETVEAAAEE